MSVDALSHTVSKRCVVVHNSIDLEHFRSTRIYGLCSVYYYALYLVVIQHNV